MSGGLALTPAQQQPSLAGGAQTVTVSGNPEEIDRTVLLVDGQEYTGWTEIKVTRSLEQAAAQFELAVSELWPLQQDAEPWRITPGKECILKVSGDVVLTGWVDSYAPNFNATTHEVRVTGRSKTCDFVDSSVTEDGGQFKNMTVEEIAKRLVEPFKLEVKVDPSFKGDEKIPEVQVQQGETCFELVEKLCRLQECLLTDDETGALVLTRAGAGKCSSRLVQNANILVAAVTLNNAQRFSDYTVKAQRPGGRTQDDKNPDIVGGGPDEGDDEGDNDYGPDGEGGDGGDGGDGRRPPGYESRALRRWRADVAALAAARAGGAQVRRGGSSKGSKTLTQIAGGVKDPDITRYRPKVIVAESQCDAAEATKRADWECRRRIGKSIEAQITVVGWRQQDGRLWKINEMVRVTAPWLSMDRELVIAEVAFDAGTDGQTTGLKLTLPDAFLPEKTREAKKAGTGTGAKKDLYPDIKPIPAGGADT